MDRSINPDADKVVRKATLPFVDFKKMVNRKGKQVIKSAADEDKMKKQRQPIDLLLLDLGIDPRASKDSNSMSESIMAGMASEKLKDKLNDEKKKDVMGQYSIGRYIKGNKGNIFDPNMFIDSDLDKVGGGLNNEKKTFVTVRGEVDLQNYANMKSACKDAKQVIKRLREDID